MMLCDTVIVIIIKLVFYIVAYMCMKKATYTHDNTVIHEWHQDQSS